MVRVSELINKKDIKSWEKSSVVFISAQTGQGKSHFIKNSFYDYCFMRGFKVLYLVHRDMLKEDVSKDLLGKKQQLDNMIENDEVFNNFKDKSNVFTVATYQSIQSALKNDKDPNLDQFNYIICDEYQYFLNDSNFSRFTDLDFRAIMTSKATKIMLSATGNKVRQLVEKLDIFMDIPKPKIISYDKDVFGDANYTYIKKVLFYKNDEAIEDVLQGVIDRGEKAIVFMDNAVKLEKLYKKFKEKSLFMCSKNTKKPYRKSMDLEKRAKIINENTFQENILFSTLTIDAGFNMRDDKLKTIICDVEDMDSLIQCIGRKRLDFDNTNDYLNVYIKNMNKRDLLSAKRKYESKLTKFNEYISYDNDEDFKKNNPRFLDSSGIVWLGYDGKININELKMANNQLKMNLIESIMKEYEIEPYKKEVLKRLGKPFEDGDIENLEQQQKSDTLEDYLKVLVGKWLYKEQQQELIDRINLMVNGRQQKSIPKLNEGLKMLNLKFAIDKGKDSRRKLEDGSENPNRNIAYWIIQELK